MESSIEQVLRAIEKHPELKETLKDPDVLAAVLNRLGEDETEADLRLLESIKQMNDGERAS